MCRKATWAAPFDSLRLRTESSGLHASIEVLDAEFGADGVGDGVGVVVHGGFGFGFDHDAGQGFGAAVADDDAAGVGKLVFGGGDGGGDGGDRFERALLADLDVDDDLGEDLEVGGELVDGFAGAGDEIEDDEGGEQAVAGGGADGEEDVAGLLAAEGGVVESICSRT